MGKTLEEEEESQNTPSPIKHKAPEVVREGYMIRASW